MTPPCGLLGAFCGVDAFDTYTNLELGGDSHQKCITWRLVKQTTRRGSIPQNTSPSFNVSHAGKYVRPLLCCASNSSCSLRFRTLSICTQFFYTSKLFRKMLKFFILFANLLIVIAAPTNPGPTSVTTTTLQSHGATIIVTGATGNLHHMLSRMHAEKSLRYATSCCHIQCFSKHLTGNLNGQNDCEWNYYLSVCLDLGAYTTARSTVADRSAHPFTRGHTFGSGAVNPDQRKLMYFDGNSHRHGDHFLSNKCRRNLSNNQRDTKLKVGGGSCLYLPSTTDIH